MTPDPALDRLAADLLDRINRGQRFEQLFADLYSRLRGLVPCDRLAVALLDDSREKLSLIACHSDGPEALKVGYADPVAGSPLEELLRIGRPRVLNDLPAYLAAKPASRSTRLIVREGMKANLTLPLLADGRPVGVVFFSSRTPGVYSDHHAELLRRLAGQLAVSIEKARLLEALEERKRELAAANDLKDRFLQQLHQEVARQTRQLADSEARLRLLVEIGRIVNAGLALRPLFGRAAAELRRLTACDHVSLALREPDGDGRHGFTLD